MECRTLCDDANSQGRLLLQGDFNSRFEHLSFCANFGSSKKHLAHNARISQNKLSRDEDCTLHCGEANHSNHDCPIVTTVPLTTQY